MTLRMTRRPRLIARACSLEEQALVKTTAKKTTLTMKMAWAV